MNISPTPPNFEEHATAIITIAKTHCEGYSGAYIDPKMKMVTIACYELGDAITVHTQLQHNGWPQATVNAAKLSKYWLVTVPLNQSNQGA